MKRTELGYNADRVLTFTLLAGRAPAPEQRLAFVTAVRDRLRALPGVKSVTAASPFPLAELPRITRWGGRDAVADASRFQSADFQTVLPGYFEALQVPLVEGRYFTEADNIPASTAIIIDRLLAQKAFPNESAVGKRLLIRLGGSRQVMSSGPPACPNCEWAEVIGVVAHARLTTPAEVGREQFYVTDGFMSYGGVDRWAIRTDGDARSAAAAVRQALSAISPVLVPANVETMSTLVSRAEAPARFSLLLMGVLGGMAAALVVIGLYGVLATVVHQRRSEIGVRMALGQSRAGVSRLILGYGMRIVLAGMILGLAGGLAATRLMTSMLVGIDKTDPFTYVAVSCAFVAIAAAACWIPARRAAGFDPVVVLRE